jgi:hypothetical protein
MTIPLRQALVWQDSTSLDAFITRLTDDADRVRQNLRTFVVGDNVAAQLDTMLGELGRRLADSRDMGRYIYGNFGSGKSHLMTVLGKMLEGDEEVYDIGHPALRRLRGRHPWLGQQKMLVLRINMMNKQTLTRALYEAYNAALPTGTPQLSFTDEERVFSLMDIDADRLGGPDKLVEQMSREGATGLPNLPPAQRVEWIARMRRGGQEQRLSLAAAFLNWRNRGATLTQAEELWVDARTGLDRIARHAQSLGYTALGWLIDELIIWIRGKGRAEYIAGLNTISSMVDHDAARVLPFFVAVAVQHDIKRTCPDDISENDFQEHIRFIQDRFTPPVTLEDQDLYEVAAQRVLARNPAMDPADERAFEEAIEQLFSRNRQAIEALSGGLSLEFVRRLYPFHPALLRILVDVTQVLSRNRTAVAALYLLLERYGDLRPGKFIPVGALWDILFTSENVSALRQNSSSRSAQRMADSFATMERIDGKVAEVAPVVGFTPDALRALVRTVLLCQLSERPYAQGRPLSEGVTASTLLRLNQTEVTASHERVGLSQVSSAFRRLGGLALQVQVSPPDNDPQIHIKTEQVDIEKVLVLGRGEVNHAQRFAYIRRLVNEELGLGLRDGTEATLEVTWKGTKRKGKVKLANVRTLPYAGTTNAFDPQGQDFLLLVDYPFDEESGRGQQDDVDTVERARARASHWTLAWLPAHLSDSEREALDNAAAVEVIRRDERRFFENISPREAETTRRALEGFQAGRKGELIEAIRRVYFGAGSRVESLKALLGVVSVASVERAVAMETLGKHILDKRFPSHPDFRRRVNNADLGSVAEWVIRAAKLGQPVELRATELALAEAFALPLDLVWVNAGSITRRVDGRYLSAIRAWIGERTSFDAHELRTLLMADRDSVRTREAEGWGFGLTKEVANLLLLYLLEVEGYEALVNERSTTIGSLGDLPERFRLVKDDVVDASTWDKATRVTEFLFGQQRRADLPSSPEQARLSREVGTKGRELLDAVKGYLESWTAVASWAGVDLPQSMRAGSALRLRVFLEGVVGETGNAPRMRRLAVAAEVSEGSAPVARFAFIRQHLADERSALALFPAQRLAFQQLSQRGDEGDQTVVITRLRNLLRDDWDTSLLKSTANLWARVAEERFAALLDRERERSAGEEAAERARRVAEEEQRRSQEAALAEARAATERAEAESRRLEAERRAQQAEAEQRRQEAEAAEQAAAEARRLAELAVRQRVEEEIRRTRRQERSCEGGREVVGRSVQRELEAALAENPSPRVRVRIIVESLE